jgi:DNA-binding response OmpR family regulator
MQSQQDYLLIIDPKPLDKDLYDYFIQFNIQIIHQNSLYPLAISPKLPCALLIDYSLIHDALNTIAQIYLKYPVPILITSSHYESNSCITVLESGADDFVVKPLYPRELHARINAISRRVNKAQEQLTIEKEVLLFANWRLYPASRRVFNQENHELALSVGEYDLLLIFVQQPQKTLDRELLLQATKSSDLNPFDRRIDVQISRLRQKIEPDPKHPTLIKTIRNGGYMFTESVKISQEPSSHT